MKKFVLIVLCCFIALSFVCAKEGEARTHKGDRLTDVVPQDCKLYSLAEKADASANSFSDALVRTIEMPESLKNLSAEEQLLNVYNRIIALSTLKGATYISWSAGNTPVELFSDAYHIKGKNEFKKISDPVVTEVPAKKTYYACLTDTKFGANSYQIDCEASEDEVMICISNISKVKYMGIKCADSYGLKMYVDVKLREGQITVSSMVTVYDREPKITVLFKTVDLPDLFMRRITALSDWFERQINNN